MTIFVDRGAENTLLRQDDVRSGRHHRVTECSVVLKQSLLRKQAARIASRQIEAANSSEACFFRQWSRIALGWHLRCISTRCEDAFGIDSVL
jgi:ABC-type Fe2+-enterobactin transport system substrate-binding protein